jgi:hypothetical protein
MHLGIHGRNIILVFNLTLMMIRYEMYYNPITITPPFWQNQP